MVRLLFPLVLSLLPLCWYIFQSGETHYPVSLPFLIYICVLVEFVFEVCARGNWRIRLSEIGLVFVAISSLYILFPVSLFLLNGYQYLPTSDCRLYVNTPRIEEIGSLVWLGVAYLSAFSIAYLSLRGKAQIPETVSVSFPTEFPSVTVFLYAFVTIVLFALSSFFLGDNLSYGESYTTFWSLPREIRQIWQIFSRMPGILESLLCVMIMANTKKWKWFLVALLVYRLGVTVVKMHDRTGLLMLFMFIVISYDLFVRPIKLKYVLLLAGTSLASFIVLGQVRSFGDSYAVHSMLDILAHNEFEAVFATDFDVQRLLADAPVGVNIFGLDGIDVWLSDLTFLIPQQILPFQKVDLSMHIISTLYPVAHASGNNFPGGVLLEALMGFGIPDIMVRGVIMGLFWGYIYKSCITKVSTPYKAALYIWLTTISYVSYARGTFIVAHMLAYGFIPTVVLHFMLLKLVRRFRLRTRASLAASPS